MPFILCTEGSDDLKHGKTKMVCDRTHVALSSNSSKHYVLANMKLVTHM